MFTLVQNAQRLKNNIEKLRKELNKMPINHGNNNRLIEKSRELDRLINDYNNLNYNTN